MLVKHKIYRDYAWPIWLKQLEALPKKVLLIHGIMGSDLRDYDPAHEDGGKKLWVDLGIRYDMRRLEYCKTTSMGSTDCKGARIYARDTVDPPLMKSRP